MANPDEITGSPVKKVDYEYTIEYEQLRDQQVSQNEYIEDNIEEAVQAEEE